MSNCNFTASLQVTSSVALAPLVEESPNRCHGNSWCWREIGLIFSSTSLLLGSPAHLLHDETIQSINESINHAAAVWWITKLQLMFTSEVWTEKNRDVSDWRRWRCQTGRFDLFLKLLISWAFQTQQSQSGEKNNPPPPTSPNPLSRFYSTKPRTQPAWCQQSWLLLLL